MTMKETPSHTVSTKMKVLESDVELARGDTSFNLQFQDLNTAERTP